MKRKKSQRRRKRRSQPRKIWAEHAVMKSTTAKNTTTANWRTTLEAKANAARNATT